MSLIIIIHEYEIKPDVNKKDFEYASKEADKKGLFKLPGLKEYHFVKGKLGSRKDMYAAIWIYESREAWEDEVLTDFLIGESEKITFTSYKKPVL